MKKFSLPKRTIIKKKFIFSDIIQEGRKASTLLFRASFIKADDLCVGFTVQKGYKNKVLRNKLKRQLRELWRTNHHDFKIRGKIILVIKMDALKRTYSEKRDDFRKLLKKIEYMSI